MNEAMLFQAGSAVEGNTTIPLYDWDGVTLLASAIVPKEASLAEAWAAIRAATAELMGPVARAAYLAGAYDPDTYYYDPDYPLTAKKSYSFGKWLALGDGAWTSYGLATKVSNVTTLEELPEPAGADRAAVPWGGLKAAYKGVASELALYDSNAKRRYTWSLVRAVRRGNTANADLTLRIARNGVHRVRVLGLRLVMEINNEQIISYFEVPNRDTVDVTFFAHKNVGEYSFSLIDGSVENVTMSSIRADSLLLIPGGEDGWMWAATLGWMNKQFRLNSAVQFPKMLFTDIGITLVAGEVHGTTAADNTTQVCAAARLNLLTAWKEKNGITGEAWPAEGDYAELTQPEMVAAIASGHYAG